MPAVELPDGRVASYEIVGEGEPMLMLPGGPGLAASYLGGMGELLSDRFQSYLVDPPGSGDSSPPSDPADYNHLGHARFYDDVRRSLDLERVSVLGHSFGGTVALTYAALYPAATYQCICLDGLSLGAELEGADAEAIEADMQGGLERHAGAPWYAEARSVWDSWTDRVLQAEAGSEIDEMMATVQPLYFSDPDRPEIRDCLDELVNLMHFNLAAVKVWEEGLWQTIDLRDLLPRIESQLLVIAGADDLICGPAQANLIARDAPHATLVVIPNCGHNPWIEAPGRLKTAVIDWVETIDPRRPS